MLPPDLAPSRPTLPPPPPPPEPRAEIQAYTARAGDSLESIARSFKVSEADLREANPQVFGNVPPALAHPDPQIDPGTALTIPAAPMSALVDEPLDTGFNPTYPSSNSEYTVGADGQTGGGALTWNPGDGSVKLGGSRIATPPGQAETAAVQWEARADTAVTLGQTNKDGNTEVTVEVQYTQSVGVEAGTRTSRGVVEGEASAGAGGRARYKVTLPGENQNPELAARINPFDPTTIPEGASVTLDGQNFVQGELAGSFRHIGTATRVTEAAGASYSVERVDADHVRVTMGPNAAVEAFNGVGLRSDIATAMLGRQDNLGDQAVATATFDLSSADGQAAYAHFVATGEVAHETAGVGDVATIEKLDYASQTRLQLELGPLSADLAGAQNTGAFVRTTYPDGSSAVTMDLRYSGNVPLSVTQRFDAEGVELVDERAYEFELSTDHDVDLSWWDNLLGRSDAEAEAALEQSHAELLNWAINGGATGPAHVRPGETVTLQFSEDQLAALLDQTRTAAAANESGMDALALLAGGENGMLANGTMDFAVAMARNLGGDDYGFAQRLFDISQGADGDLGDRGAVPLDVTIERD
ncbi:LysM peptidoglycan-binding domain-containing protein [Coralloluteibacterium stylophorae]|uniref:LysM peptidoglycan-binding domain-containing protein n=1 Tax=Coralloluteibacterium stylophorae TaxID=1776034 RepID=A0AAP2C990_9GAMM|nr:LysM domain-containing protein [Coralloluteibacterium stylophorae]MBS7456039.1 LysM peptidoglycan-binding domain-containing protein [Coralloluteibacterium stylophorae]